ncbi:Ulvan-active sulfatase [Paenibacillus solanacearum]|uniref:Ulvan-active sulfatase n=1 Tax=Paenibacillus solanacearum TaxID=2048548 RepID=A0A916NSB0_9BACL|nr:sulfatase [Paenibacillus solanacearum]CAG7648426.1 Ulvan-active sulfatase [Paenibacillus solanacearum]
MNIVYFHTHDTGRYIQPYGYAVPTPHLQSFAEEAALFRQAFCAGPTCSPSRSGLLTGMAPHSNGMLGLAHRGFRLNDCSQHLASFLARNGYETALSGVQHENHGAGAVNELGYKQNLNLLNEARGGEVRDLQTARLAAEFIGKQGDAPFFLTVGLHNTHRAEFDFPQTSRPVDSRYVMPPHPMYDTAANRKDMAGFIASAAVVDECFGIVRQAIKDAGKWDDTILIFTTDHGIPFPRMKCYLYDTGIGVSLMMRVPGRREGLVIDTIVSQIDLFPTLCEITGIAQPDWLQGCSLVPLLDGSASEVRSELFSEVTYHAAYEPMRCVRTERYKLIRFYDDHDQIVMSNMDNGLSKQFLMQHGIRERSRSKDMLFDLYLDPVERENMIDDPAYASMAADLAARLESWMRRTDDPLLQGSVPAPEGVRVNSLDSLHPNNGAGH